ncbi:hypothetical protein [Leptospira stimsonii]|nr:hypothetical protein [Leptospira stimsonii]
MKKSMLILMTVVAVTVANCTYKYKEAPEVGTSVLRLAEADYTVGAETSGKACGFFLFHVIGSALFGGNFGSIGFGYVGSLTAEAQYDALSKLETATYIVNPKYESESTNYVIGTHSCVTVKARAITLKNGPVASK